MDDGSAANMAMSGAAGGGASTAFGGGGGGGGGGAFFLQPEANATKTIAIQITLQFRFNNMISASRIFSKTDRFSPDGRPVIARRGQLAHLSSVGHHAPDLVRAAPRRHEHQVPPIGRPTRVLVPAFTVSQLVKPTRSHVHQKDIEIPGRITPRP